MEFNIIIDSIKTDFEAVQVKDGVEPGEEVYVVTFEPVVVSKKDLMELTAKSKMHTIKMYTKED